MIRSMTGFGRAPFRIDSLELEVELRSVNHRYLDLRVKLPRSLAFLESDLRAQVADRFARGKVDLLVSAPGGAPPPSRLDLDLPTARAYLESAQRLRDQEGASGTLGVEALLALPGVARFVEPELPEEEWRGAVRGAVAAALDAADAMRAAEGAALERELLERLAQVEALVAGIDARSDSVQAAARERLQKRALQLREETGLLDEARLHQEIVIAADRMDVTEELVRLRSHVEQFREILASADSGRPVGRRLDFLLQELGREANTVGSKSADAPVAHQVVELKTQLERLREQVQNVE